MKRFALFSLLVAATAGLTFAATSGSAVRANASCGCTDCRCPDCNGVFCTCDVCECGNCGCAAAKGTANAAVLSADYSPSAVEATGKAGCCAK